MWRKFLTSILALLCLCPVNAQLFKSKNASDGSAVEEWRDVAVFELYKKYPRANVIPYAKENDIEKLLYKNSPFYVSLNGTWKYNFQTNASQRIDVAQKGFSASSWSTTSVPQSAWKSGNDIYRVPTPKSSSDISGTSNAVTTYVKDFNAPKSWSNYKVYLHLQAKSAYYIWVNQQFVGYSEDSRAISEFDISKHIKVGKSNQLAVQVVAQSTGSLLESEYASTFNGIYGDVYLTLKPSVNIDDYAIRADYNADNKFGVFNIDVSVANPTKKGQYYVEVELWTPQGKQLDKMGRWTVFDKKSEVKTTFERQFYNVLPWSAETPNLYTVVVRLRNEKMEVIETVGTRTGFRSIEIKEGQLLLNGTAITLRGAVYADYRDGKPLSQDAMKADIAAMKQHNINAIRTAYYSPMPPFFYELCDAYGMYVICDANISPVSSRSHAVATDNNFVDPTVARVQNMYEIYKNHTSIIAWSLGRSSDNGTCIDNAYRTLRRKDMVRPVIYGGAGFSDNTDIIAPTVPLLDDLKVFAARKQTRPMIIASMGSTKGNNFGGIEQLWYVVERSRHIQGGFIDPWSPLVYADGKDVTVQGVVSSTGEAKPYLKEIGNAYRLFDVSLVRISPDAGEFNVTNRLNFLSLNDYILEYTIFSNLKQRIIEGEVSVDLKPGESKNFKLKIPKLTLYAGEELFIRFTVKQREETIPVPRGTALSTVEFKLPMAEVDRYPIPEYGREQLSFSYDTNGSGNVILHIINSGVDVSYDMSTADIISIKQNSKELLSAPPRIHFWRAPTDNDLADNNQWRLWQNLDPSQVSREVLATNAHRIDNFTIGIDAMLRYNDKQGRPLFDVKQSLAVLHTGDVLIDNEVVASEHIRAVPRIGLTMGVPQSLDSVYWFGGDNESYVDRQRSSITGTHSSSAKSMTFMYERPQSSGNRVNTRWVAVTDKAVGLFIDMIDSSFQFSVSQYSDAQLSQSPSRPIKEQYNIINVDYKHAVVGSSTANMSISEEQIINYKKYHFTLHLRPYDIEEYSPQDFRRVKYPQVKSTVLPMPVISSNKERFDSPMQITLSCAEPKVELRYTLDGSTPTEASPLYKKPFTINASTLVKAKAFKRGATPSFVSNRRFNYDYIVSAKFANNANTPYNYNTETALFDGEEGDARDLSRGWLGFSGTDLSVVFTLSKAIELQQVMLNFAHVPDAWAFAPSAVSVQVSSDGVNYSMPIPAKIKYDPSSELMNSAQVQKITIDINLPDVKYVKIVAKNLGKIPAWHKAKGLKPWIMVDEVQLNEVIK